MNMRTRNPFVPAVIVAALTIGSLAACSSGGNTNYVSSHTPSSSSQAGSGSGSDAGQKSEELPSDFPKADVPLVDGTVVVARGDKDNGWSVTVQPSEKKTGFADAQTALKDKGFTEQPGSSETKAVYTSDKYTVAVGTPGVSVTYTVTAN